MVKQCSDMCQKRCGLRNTLKQCSKSGQPWVSQGSPGVQPGVQPGVSQGAVMGRQGSPAGQPGVARGSTRGHLYIFIQPSRGILLL